MPDPSLHTQDQNSMQPPDFMIIGAPKCGTSSLHYYLSQHPDICMSEPKEPFFFEAEYERGLSYYLETYFAHHKGERLIGEASPRNLYLPYVPRRIAEFAPKAKLIIMLREPVSRAYSAWWMEHSEGRDDLDFPAAVANNLERLEAGIDFEGSDGEKRWKGFLEEYAKSGRMRYRSYVDMGYYAEQIERYLAFMPRSQLLILLQDDLRADPDALMERVFQFLDVDNSVHLDMTPARVSVGPIGARLRRISHRIPGTRWLPRRTVDITRRVLRRLGDEVPTIDRATDILLAEHYVEHNRRLARLLGDVTVWVRP